MFEESNARLKKIMKGDYSRDQVADAYREFAGQTKLLAVLATIHAVESKNRRVIARLAGKNLMDEHTAINLGLPVGEGYVVCAQQDGRTVTKEECLDYSGSHVDECRGCEAGRAVRSALIDGK